MYVQLAVFLRHYAHKDEHHLNTARECNVAAGTVFLYVDRVTRAIQSHRGHFVRMGDNTRRNEVCAAFNELGFEHAMGAADGSLIRLSQVPVKDGMYYYCRKKFYAVRKSCLPVSNRC